MNYYTTIETWEDYIHYHGMIKTYIACRQWMMEDALTNSAQRTSLLRGANAHNRWVHETIHNLINYRGNEKIS